MAATTTAPQVHADADEGRWLAPGPAGRRAGARLLDLDPGLARRLDPALRERLSPALRVGVATLEPGVVRPSDLPAGPASLGLLVLDGLLLRDLSVHQRCCAELLGPGDLLRPWPDPDRDAGALVASELAWQVVGETARLAVIDGRATLLIGRVPALMGELLDRSLTRARALQFQLALSQIHGIAQRLELLLWQLADRWGRVTVDGVVLPLNLTHEMLGRLIGARRPSVTTAVRRLQEHGSVLRVGDGWLLRSDPATGVGLGVSAC